MSRGSFAATKSTSSLLAAFSSSSAPSRTSEASTYTTASDISVPPRALSHQESHISHLHGPSGIRDCPLFPRGRPRIRWCSKRLRAQRVSCEDRKVDERQRFRLADVEGAAGGRGAP